MIGRNDTSAVNAYGCSRSPDIKGILEQANQKINLKFNYNDDKRVGGSDHVPFFRKDIPFLFLITGMHDDYHKPTDTWEKLIPEKMAQVAKVIFGCAWQVANMDGRPKLVELE